MSAWAKPLQLNVTDSNTTKSNTILNAQNEKTVIALPPKTSTTSSSIKSKVSTTTTVNSTITESSTSVGNISIVKEQESNDGNSFAFESNRIVVLDTGSFVHYTKFEQHGSVFITTPQVLKEIKDSKSKHILYTLPFDLSVREPLIEDIQTVARYAKKTGDFANLSSTDLGVLALTLRIELELHGNKNIKPEPQAIPITGYFKCPNPLPYSVLDEKLKKKRQQEAFGKDGKEPEEIPEEEENNEENNEEENEENVEENNGEEENNNNEEEQDEEEEEEDDDWITPENIKDYKERMGLIRKEEWMGPKDTEENQAEEKETNKEEEEIQLEEDNNEEKEENNEVENKDETESTTTNSYSGKIKYISKLVNDKPEEVGVGCITTDYCIQNVLLHMGLNLISIDGYRIKYLVQWVKRCTSCFTVVPDVRKVFCPSCGNDSLRRITAVLEDDGQVNFYYNPKAKFNLRGTIYTMPLPKGGKWSKDPIYRGDQLIQRSKRSALNKKKDDYWNEEASFKTIRPQKRFGNQGAAKEVYNGFGRRNPNEPRRNGGKKKR
ncbi:hypothetical protein ABK040_016198 [Willaertia magna]